MSEYGSNPPRDPENGESGNPEQRGGQNPPSYGQQPPQYGQQNPGQPGQYGQPEYGAPGQNQPGQNQPGQNQPGQNQPGQNQPGQYGQPPYGQPGQSGPQPTYGQPGQQPTYGQPGQQPQYGQQGQPYGQPGQYGAQPQYGQGYGSNPYGQPGQSTYGSPLGQPGSNIPANVEFASMGRRLSAQLIDGLILSVVLGILAVLLLGLPLMNGDITTTTDADGTVTTTGGEGLAAGLLGFYALAFIIPLVYQIVMIALKGATVGKMVLGVRVVRIEDGQLPGWVPSLLRWLIPTVGGLACGIGQFVVYISPFFDSSGRNQGWHDMVAKTVVIKV
ncbi:RDD family protein [Kineosporia succinea]|uniref:RDD family membrane protein YckC n=1 Tax=Kineosporia succinea TaxID=84632 RepID=A0ABT9PFQ0_9ACTN|nr:RDD family protein [Kineosporia succinea]MDP9831316.1 putative RDD family membrane protein YckC [Kineosporia succinea]